ncbi:MAG: DUF1553 domain-containing protein [Planctomycetota bacterium]|nr:MAG: DUF1553 domain-containing protein [Planctomycetota bacterium]
MMQKLSTSLRGIISLASFFAMLMPAVANPAHKAGMIDRYGRLLAKSSASCKTCHVLDPGISLPTRLSDIPHNAFGLRLANWPKLEIEKRLANIAREDTDGDGVSNELELLTGTNPGEKTSTPTQTQQSDGAIKQLLLAYRLADYAFRPFKPVTRPAFIRKRSTESAIDSILGAYQDARSIVPVGVSSNEMFLRRATMDLTGLPPTVKERELFLSDKAPDSRDRLVNRLLAKPSYGERWGRHFMDIWRYSDWAGWNDGNQIRDSQPHIWRWRDWIIESLNANVGYDRLLMLMLAADEVAPTDQGALRATGFLARNYKLLSRETWMEDTVNHTSKAFLGLTIHCAKCHSHMYDPISQGEYYQFRAIFENYNVRTERVPGEPDSSKTALVRVYDADINAKTYLFPRGDDRNPDTSYAYTPGIPAFLGGAFQVAAVRLPAAGIYPEVTPFVVEETRTSLAKALEAARTAKGLVGSNVAKATVDVIVAEYRCQVFEALRTVEGIEIAQGKTGTEWGVAAKQVVRLQRALAVAEARQKWTDSQIYLQNATDADRAAKKAAVDTAHQELVTAQARAELPVDSAYVPRVRTFPSTSTGKRTAFATWLTDTKNPLTARVIVNQIWMRHFGTALVPSVADFGHNSQAVEHGKLVDWLAAELMTSGWNIKHIHRIIMHSAAYQRDSRPTLKLLERDPDNISYWRFAPHRLEAEGVRDAILAVSGQLDTTMGGPEIDHTQGLVSLRRSVYLRSAPEKEAEFLKVFDGPSVTECYERKQSILPQQALALANSQLALREARRLAQSIVADLPNPSFALTAVRNAFLTVLTREPTGTEMKECLQFLSQAPDKAPSEQGTSGGVFKRRMENLVVVLLNHHAFVTIQ